MRHRERGTGRRLLTAALLTALLTGCSVVLGPDGPDPDGARAHSRDGSVEVWDLRGRPSGAAFGASDDDLTPTYESGDGRAVRLLLPGGRTLEVENATTVSFACFGADEPDCWQFGVTTSSDPSAGISTFYDCLDELRLPRGTGTQYEIDVAVADEGQEARNPGDPQVESPKTPVESTRLDGLSIGCSARYNPDAELSRVDIIGNWHEQADPSG